MYNIINLVYPDKSPEPHKLNYNILSFPDGQQDIVITSFLHDGMNIIIKSRFNGWKDLELIIATTKALERAGVKHISLYIPYLLGARSDRAFVEGGNSYLVDVIAPVINAQNYDSVIVKDVHSDVAAACIKKLFVNNNVDLVNFAMQDIITKSGVEFALVSPDAGSLKKIYHVAKEIGHERDIIVCSKYRDTNGNLSKTHVPIPINEFSKGQSYIIIDDICDGGRTFINIAKEIKIIDSESKIYLIVTHGIFSNGFVELGQYFSAIYCTNSVKDHSWSHSEEFIKQLNVF